MDLVINLDFIPENLDGSPILRTTLAKEVGRLLCESIDTEYCMEKYLMGKELFTTGAATFVDTSNQNTIELIAYFKNFCNKYQGFSNEIKGQILLKFI